MGNGRIAVPVTEDLMLQLIRTEAMIAQLDTPSVRIKDTVDYAPAVLQLEALAKAVLGAQASVSLIGGPTGGAAIFVQSGSSVMQALDVVIKYLRNEAANLLRHDGGALSQYEKTHTLNVRNQLQGLHDRIVEDIRTAANADLRMIADTGAELLVATANVIAKIASGDADGVQAAAGPAETAPATDGSGRCTVMLMEGGRCTKREGHRTSSNQDPHTPN